MDFLAPAVFFGGNQKFLLNSVGAILLLETHGKGGGPVLKCDTHEVADS
jgi:hypothetical protein